MPRRYTPREVERIVRRLGWEFSHQTGSHVIYTKPGFSHVVIPESRSQVRVGTLASVCRQLGVTRFEFDKIALEVL
ncbi:MAG TPA: type II toxin-antitoxin system HicA family toxin [Dehalococcoidia bacterium]|nr:type II toxin-antitoxin system HicA family toxin [Dehalococcoidia bacterium]